MPIARAVFDQISEADIDELVRDTVREGLLIEYKRDPYGNADADRRELLKDLSSFANSSGGHLVIGIEENAGLPIRKSPYGGDADQELQRMENLIRAGLEPRIIGIRMKAVPIAAGGHVFVARIPKSWNPPHRVTLQGTNRFFVRTSVGAHEASVEELRALFGTGATLQDRLVAYRNNRLARLAANDGIVPLAHDLGRLVLHVVPLSAFANQQQIDLVRALENNHLLLPMGAAGHTPTINFDGFANIRGGDQCFGYTQIFRNGIIEATKVPISRDGRAGERGAHMHRIPMRTFGEALLPSIPLYIRALEELEVSPPFALMISLQEVRGVFLGLRDDPLLEGQRPIDRSDLELPIQQIDAFGDNESYREAIRPAMDALFNSVGFASADPYLINFDAEGRWVVR